MPIKNYTTKIDAYVSLGEIQGALAKNGARKIMIDYDDAGAPSGIAFQIVTAYGSAGFILPANADGVKAAFARQKVKVDADQAMRTAWRNVRDWILAQMAFIESGNAEMNEVFMPYLADRHGNTLYKLYSTGQLSLPMGGDA